MKHVRKITGTNPLGHSKWTLTTHNSTALRREFEISHLNKEQRDALFRCFCCCLRKLYPNRRNSSTVKYIPLYMMDAGTG